MATSIENDDASTQVNDDHTILQYAFEFAAHDRHDPDTHERGRLIINSVVAVKANFTEAIGFPLRDVSPAVILGRYIDRLKSITYTPGGSGGKTELEGWMTAGVVANVAAAAHEVATNTQVTVDERLQLQHALATFAGLRETLESMHIQKLALANKSDYDKP